MDPGRDVARHDIVEDFRGVRSEAGALDFHRLGEPTRAEVERVAAWTHAGLLRVLARHGPAGRQRPTEAVGA